MGWNSSVWVANARPNYTEEHNWFSVFGVFFPALTGVMAGRQFNSIQIIWAIFGAILWPILYVGSTVLEAVYPYQFNYWAIF